MPWVVETAVGRTDLAAVLAAMRVWFDHNRCNPDRFETMRSPEGIILIRVEFTAPRLGEEFERAFGPEGIRPGGRYRIASGPDTRPDLAAAAAAPTGIAPDQRVWV